MPLSHSYYDGLNLKPGIGFYIALSSTGYPLNRIKVKIPDTFCSFENDVKLYTNLEGTLQRSIGDINPRIFYQSSKEFVSSNNDIIQSPTIPGFVIRTDLEYDQGGMDCEVYSCKDSWKRFLTGIESNSIIQKYVLPFKNKMILYRLVYYESIAKSQKVFMIRLHL